MKRGFLNNPKAKNAHNSPSSKKGIAAVVLEGSKVPMLPYGKVKDPGVPEDYKCEATMRPRGINLPIPMVIANGSPIPKPRHPNICVVKPVPGAGLGVFTTCDVQVGELIFSERPLLVAPCGLSPPLEDIPDHYSSQQIQQIIMFEREELLQHAVGRMSDEQRAAFMSLANAHMEDGSGPILGIIRTNAFSISNVGDGPDPPPGRRYPPEASYSAVCELGSRINHRYRLACRTLLSHSNAPPVQCNSARPETSRRASSCKCPACLNATSATDRLRIEFPDKVTNLVNQAGVWLQSLHQESDFLDSVLQYEKKVIAEGLHSQHLYQYIFRIIDKMYRKLGMHDKAKPYADLEHRWSSMASDQD
ncbi:unnamed protein product [Cyclocybe aegerita]|uniref:SET domain-containing protein n=1 Tax=Cyclocybe aegerita TaxID=1973307 RepID=A0A8S0VUE5_CYCAE|nr:unnamed protein product [Cyclocybe aegerita]